MDIKYLSCAETAKLVRKALKKEFPEVKFSVRSRDCDAIYISWTDGATEKMVKDVTDCFEGAGFDGMIDLEYFVTSWMLPSGEVGVARSPGTESSMGCNPAINNSIPPGAELVSFGAKYIFGNRTVSPPKMEAARLKVCEYWGLDPSDYKFKDETGYNGYKWVSIPKDWITNANNCFDKLVLNEAYSS